MICRPYLKLGVCDKYFKIQVKITVRVKSVLNFVRATDVSIKIDAISYFFITIMS